MGWIINTNLIKRMDPRVSELHITNSKCVKEYAYFEDKNFPTRKNMEDSTPSPTQITSPSTTSVTQAPASSPSSTATEALRSPSSAPMSYPMSPYPYPVVRGRIQKE